ncbi:hypothetical protein [Sporolactobacillus laevolacticus]|uniref:Transposase n=1 Tax=Sporolactobacillus laevolacticus DSM 442 TaxID=1395513 RepID=V6J0F3_9BACL|nr:hypothetical protein [Sporolactobacillus laevolacticus]EST10234.1 transposase [Sporolactobacillus laevolacticus DSM 442]
MSRYSKLTEEKIIQYEKEGRGKGTGQNYNPQIKVQEFASKGTMTRTFGEKVQRQHDVFSNLEKACLYIMEYNLHVVDIREQYPLN